MNLFEERSVIIRGLVFCWSCKLCEQLGWKEEHGCPENNSDCGTFVYNKLGKHFVTISEAKKVIR